MWDISGNYATNRAAHTLEYHFLSVSSLLYWQIGNSIKTMRQWSLSCESNLRFISIVNMMSESEHHKANLTL